VEDRVATIFELVESMRNPHKILNALGVASDKVYRAAPSECIECKGKEFAKLALLGIYKHPVFFECVKCGALYLKYKRDWIEQQFFKIKGFFTNQSDWDVPPDNEFN
tara:strand:+ start:1015 stop:1335 length:321 start_codon:yes stop_codon:yes gene_type:complete